MKKKEELEVLKEEYIELKNKLAELNDEELGQVSGGLGDKCNSILIAIIDCNFLYAQQLFSRFKSSFIQSEADIIRMAFLKAAGYAID